MTHSVFKGAVDRISEGKAVILVDGAGIIALPLDKLPENVSEGDVLAFTARVDKSATSERLAESEDLTKKLKRRG